MILHLQYMFRLTMNLTASWCKIIVRQRLHYKFQTKAGHTHTLRSANERSTTNPNMHLTHHPYLCIFSSSHFHIHKIIEFDEKEKLECEKKNFCH